MCGDRPLVDDDKHKGERKDRVEVDEHVHEVGTTEGVVGEAVVSPPPVHEHDRDEREAHVRSLEHITLRLLRLPSLCKRVPVHNKEHRPVQDTALLPVVVLGAEEHHQGKREAEENVDSAVHKVHLCVVNERLFRIFSKLKERKK